MTRERPEVCEMCPEAATTFAKPAGYYESWIGWCSKACRSAWMRSEA